MLVDYLYIIVSCYMLTTLCGLMAKLCCFESLLIQHCIRLDNVLLH